MVLSNGRLVSINYPNAKELHGRRWLPPHNRPASAAPVTAHCFFSLIRIFTSGL